MKTKCLLFFTLVLAGFGAYAPGQGTSDVVKASISIDTRAGHNLIEGCSGFNVRIGDKIWSYTHPDFRKAVYELKPGWLRYFSGTMGSAFNSATGLYDHDYTWMHDNQEQYDLGYQFTKAKGPHRVTDLYNLLGEIGGKLVITVNAFTETPEIVAELARFCKNNHIIVEAWQFCNEPYFYVPHRDRFWWNDGYDYAAKMKPYADAIKAVFPEAKLSLNYTWDGIWGFMKEIHKYQQEHGAYWNVFSKHSYAPHVGQYEPFEKGYLRLNSKLIEATAPPAMKDIEKWTWANVPLLVTEFGVWNRPLNGIMSAVYNVEYTLRQLQHTNAFLIGSHEISNKYSPANNFKNRILEAHNQSLPMDTDSLSDGIVISDEGKSLRMLHKATHSSSYTYKTVQKGSVKVPGLNNTMVDGQYARAFRGNDGYDYLVVTNRSGRWIEYSVSIDNIPSYISAEIEFMWSEKAQAENIAVLKKQESLSALRVPPHSVLVASWQNPANQVSPTRIHGAWVTDKGVKLSWWKKSNAKGYVIHYGTSQEELNQRIEIPNNDTHSYEIQNLIKGMDYYFATQVTGNSQNTALSNVVKVKWNKPGQPRIFRTARRDNTITVYWNSVPDAEKYLLKVSATNGFLRHFDAGNVFGYRIEGLDYNVDYEIVVVAQNGLGEGNPSESVRVTCREGLPTPPRNISATQMPNGHVLLKWVNQDLRHPDIRFRILRGEELHQFSEIASGISGESFIDDSAEPGRRYYYTLRSYTNAGDDNYHPNIATLVLNEKSVWLEIESIIAFEDRYLVKVNFKNVASDSLLESGITLSDISYLTVEEKAYQASSRSGTGFEVSIPFKSIEKDGTYAVKAFMNANGISIYSNPPYKTITIKGK